MQMTDPERSFAQLRTPSHEKSRSIWIAVLDAVADGVLDAVPDSALSAGAAAPAGVPIANMQPAAAQISAARRSPRLIGGASLQAFVGRPGEDGGCESVSHSFPSASISMMRARSGSAETPPFAVAADSTARDNQPTIVGAVMRGADRCQRRQ